MAADLDVLIKSDADPLLAIKYHRHFTHSLLFVPLGGFISSLPWLLLKPFRTHYRWVLLAATLGYATHGPLDACTSYGTLLFWPLSQTRVSLRLISVVDIAFTLPVLACVVAAVKSKRPRWAQVGLLWGAAYLCFGSVQQYRARALQARIAEERGHAVRRAQVFPSFTNNITWRSLYHAGDSYYVDKLRLTWTGKACVTPGTSVPALRDPGADTADTAPAHEKKAARARRLFSWFSNGWVARDPGDSEVLGDLRYSFSPTEAIPIWGVRTNGVTGSVEWVNNRAERAVTFDDLITLLSRDGAGHRCF
jgi:inner membrane protein